MRYYLLWSGNPWRSWTLTGCYFSVPTLKGLKENYRKHELGKVHLHYYLSIIFPLFNSTLLWNKFKENDAFRNGNYRITREWSWPICNQIKADNFVELLSQGNTKNAFQINCSSIFFTFLFISSKFVLFDYYVIVIIGFVLWDDILRSILA